MSDPLRDRAIDEAYRRDVERMSDRDFGDWHPEHPDFSCTDKPGETCADPACPVHGESDHNLITERQALDEDL